MNFVDLYHQLVGTVSYASPMDPSCAIWSPRVSTTRPTTAGSPSSGKSMSLGHKMGTKTSCKYRKNSSAYRAYKYVSILGCPWYLKSARVSTEQNIMFRCLPVG